ncbi:unnamed protein product [Sympodiomycopsis kandeliae]
MAFFGQQNDDEIRKLKKVIAAKDLRLGSLESEKESHDRDVQDLRSQALTFQRKYDAESSRNGQLESTIARLKQDNSKQSLQITNLQSSLDKVYTRENADIKGRKLEEQQHSSHQEETRVLQEQLQSCQDELSELKAASKKTSYDPTVKILALENENTTLKNKITALQQQQQSSSSHDFLSTPKQSQSRPHRGRPRSSSISGPSSSSTPSQLSDLQTLYEESRSELAKLESRATKAEREAIKSTNEVMANQKVFDREKQELGAQIRELKDDLEFKDRECEGLLRDIEVLENDQERLQSDLSKAQSSSSSSPEKDEQIRRLQGQVSDLSSQRDRLQQHIHSLEEEMKQLQQDIADTPATSAPGSQEGDEMHDNGLHDKITSLQSTVNDLRQQLETTQSSLQRITSERDSLAVRLASTDDRDDASSSSSSSSSDEDSLAAELSRLRVDLAEKDSALEEAEALSEEDARQLQLKEAKVKSLTGEIQRLCQRARENALELEVTRAAGMGEDSTRVEAHLKQLRAELDQRDEQLLQMGKKVKSKQDEVEAGKKQLKRIVTYILSKSDRTSRPTIMSTPNGKTSSSNMTATPLSKLLHSQQYFSTPGGRPLQRSFDEDLLDEIELVREAMEKFDERSEFIKIEQETSQRYLCKQLQDKEKVLEEMQNRLKEVDGRDVTAMAETEDRMKSEISQLSATISSLEEQASTLRSELHSASERLTSQDDSHQQAIQSHQQTINSLQSDLQSSNSRADLILSISQRLNSKRDQLSHLTTRDDNLIKAEDRLLREENTLQSLEDQLRSESDSQSKWSSIAVESENHLSHCRSLLSHPVTTKSSDTKRLQEKITSLQGRILRREEQIGSQQLEIERLSANLAMVNEDYEELLEEKVDLEDEIKSIREGQGARKELQDRVERLEDELKELVVSQDQSGDEEEDGELEERIETLIEEKEQLQQTIEQLRDGGESERAVLVEEKEQLQHSLDQLQTSHQTEVADLVEEKEHLQDSLDQLRQSNLDGESRFATLCQEHAEQIKQMDTDHQANREEIARLTQSRDHLQEELTRVTTQLANQKESSASSDTDSDLHRQLAQQTDDKERLASELESLRTAHDDQVLRLENQSAQLHKELDAATEDKNLLSTENEKLAVDLAKSEDAVKALQEEVRELQDRVTAVEQSRATKEAEMARLLERQEERDSDAAKAADEAVLAVLRQEMETMQIDAEQARDEHEKTVSKLQSELATANEARADLQSQVEALAATHAHVEQLQATIEDLESSKQVLESRLAEMETRASQAEDASRSKAESLEQTATDLRTQLSSVQMELEDRLAALKGAESAIADRDAHIKLRNEEYWSLKEEVAELQEAQEQSRVVSASLAELQERLDEAEGEMQAVKSAHEDQLVRVGQELQESRARVVTLEAEVKSKSTELNDLHEQLQRSTAAHQSTQVSLDSERQARVALEAELTTLKSHSSLTSTEDVDSLRTRITELESDLSEKVEEIENADTKILNSLKEAKKLAAKVKGLNKVVSGLQAEIEGLKSGQSGDADIGRKEEEVVQKDKDTRTGSVLKDQGTSAGSTSSAAATTQAAPASTSHSAPSPSLPTSTSASFSRKRSAPDEDSTNPNSSTGTTGGMTPSSSSRSMVGSSPSTRAIYVDARPSSSISSVSTSQRQPSRPISPAKDRARQGRAFVPTRKPTMSESAAPAPPKAGVAKGGLQDLTNVTNVTNTNSIKSAGGVPDGVSNAKVAVKQPTTTTTTASGTAPGRPKSTTTTASTTTSARPTAPTSGLMKALAAKRKLGAPHA